MNRTSLSFITAGAIVGLLALSGCNSSTPTSSSTGEPSGTSDLKGTIKIDGSSTVFLVAQKLADGFMDINSGVSVNVSQSGTGGGFKKFVLGETDISNASRPIDEKEVTSAKENSVEFVEVPVGYDGLTVVVNSQNTWVDHFTVEELKKMWEPAAQGKVKLWSDIRAGWPSEEFKLYGAGTNSGTFDYFTKVIVGTEKSSRADYTQSENDNVLVTGVAGDKNAIGYFGFAYFVENKDKLKAVPIDPGTGPVMPTTETISDQSYRPLSRPEFMYINLKSLERPEVMGFFEYMLSPEGQTMISGSSVAFQPEVYAKILERVKAKTTGSLFVGKTGEPVAKVLGL